MKKIYIVGGMDLNKLLDYYNSYDEDQRLCRDNAHKIEKITTMKYLLELIPDNATILDCCAGTGQYAFALAEKGFIVTAGDIVPMHIDIMNKSTKANLLKEIYCGDILDMSSFENRCFDVVLCMGAFYHIHEKNERMKAIKECLRVLRDNGIFVLAYINRNAVFINHFKNNPTNVAKHSQIMQSGENDVFYGVDFEEITELSEYFKLETIKNIATDGLMYPLLNEINSLNETQFNEFMIYHLSTCEQQSIIGHSMHGLYFGKKSANSAI